MANIKDCPGFETFGADVKVARKVKQLSRKTLAEQILVSSLCHSPTSSAIRRIRKKVSLARR